jgi:LmbE family N-acetylglucosaminyl deacetylase
VKVLVVAAHPDDEVLGCGATIARHAAAGDEVRVLILAEGITSRGKSAGLARLRRSAQAANRRLGVRKLELGRFPDNRMDGEDLLDVVRFIERRVDAFAPALVYTHHAGDLNVDHQVTHRAVLTACRPLPGSSVVRILCFEVPSSTEWQSPAAAPTFAPNWFCDVSATLAVKLDALRAYAGEMRKWPHPRSLSAVEHLARWRGATVGVDAAEAFVLARAVERA